MGILRNGGMKGQLSQLRKNMKKTSVTFEEDVKPSQDDDTSVDTMALTFGEGSHVYDFAHLEEEKCPPLRPLLLGQLPGHVSHTIHSKSSSTLPSSLDGLATLDASSLESLSSEPMVFADKIRVEKEINDKIHLLQSGDTADSSLSDDSDDEETDTVTTSLRSWRSTKNDGIDHEQSDGVYVRRIQLRHQHPAGKLDPVQVFDAHISKLPSTNDESPTTSKNSDAPNPRRTTPEWSLKLLRRSQRQSPSPRKSYAHPRRRYTKNGFTHLSVLEGIDEAPERSPLDSMLTGEDEY